MDIRSDEKLFVALKYGALRNDLKGLRSQNYHLGLCVAIEELFRCRRESGFVDEIDLSQGQCLIGQEELAEKMKTTRNRIRSVLKSLERIRFHTIKLHQGKSVVTVINFDRYVMPSRNITSKHHQNIAESSPRMHHQPTGSLPQTTDKTDKTDRAATTAATAEVVAVDNIDFGISSIPTYVKDRFSDLVKFREFARNCDGDVDLMERFLEYADQQKGIDNPVALAISLAAGRKTMGPPLTDEQARRKRDETKMSPVELAGKIVWPAYRKARPDVDYNDYNEREDAKQTCWRIIQSKLRKKLPEKPEEAHDVAKAILNGEFDLTTGESIKNNDC